MEIIAAAPPNFDQVVAAFPFALRVGISFSWGLNTEGKPLVYCPSAERIPPLHGVIKAHENVHSEYRAWKTYERDPRKLALWRQDIAEKLAGPLYGNLVTVDFARRMLAVEVDHAKVRRMLIEGAPA